MDSLVAPQGTCGAATRSWLMGSLDAASLCSLAAASFETARIKR